TRYFVDEFMLDALSKEDLLEVALSIEYISNMNFENREVAKDVIYGAREILQKHQQIVEVMGIPDSFDKDVIEAFSDDLQNLEIEFNERINQQPMNAKTYDDLIRIAHTLRGNANIVKLTDVTKLATALENNMRSNNSYEHDKMDLYRQAFVGIIEQFKAFLQKHK
ncbi:MAG: Hpt domain-containing protein, partial [Wohlfahrtiimonas sp.]